MFFLLLLLLSFFPRLISAAADWMSAILSTHGVALVRISDGGLKPAARGSLKTQYAKKSPKIATWAPSHSFSGYIFATKARIDNWRKNLLSSNMSSTCPHNMVNFGLLLAEIVWPVWGTPPNFNSLRVLAVLLHSSKVASVSQTLWRWTEGATYVRQGDHHVRHWPTSLVFHVTLQTVIIAPMMSIWGKAGCLNATTQAAPPCTKCNSVHSQWTNHHTVLYGSLTARIYVLSEGSTVIIRGLQQIKILAT